MESTANDFRKAFETTLAEHGFTFKVEADNVYSITQVDKLYRKVKTKLICSQPINEKLHGTKNDTEIKAIGYYKFELSSDGIEPNFYIFSFKNNPDNKVEFVIIPTEELKGRLNQRNCITDRGKETELKFWLLPDDLLFETTNFGAEGDWWFVGGRMAKNTFGDYTFFLNNWNELTY